MPKTRSARGEIVDFDLVQIKESLASGPEQTNVVARQQHIDQRLRRRMRNMKATPLSTAPKPKVANSSVTVDAKLAEPDDVAVELIDEVEETEDKKPTQRRSQKTRPKAAQDD